MCSDHRRTIPPAILPVRRRVRRERVAFTDAPLRLAGLIVTGGDSGGGLLQNTAAHVSPKPYQSYRRLPGRFLQRHLQPPGGRVDPPSEVGSEEMVPGLWCRV